MCSVFVNGEIVYALMVKEFEIGWVLNSLYRDRESAQNIMNGFIEQDKKLCKTERKYVIEECVVR